ncbi:hypothetical protein ACROYT_G028915 [Oculina patagonica]
MTVTVSHAKAENIKHVCKDLLTKTQPTIRKVAVVIGKLVASFPGVAMGPLFYRQLENEKTAALKFHHGNFDESMVLSPTAKSDLQWWVENIGNVSKPISQEGGSRPSLWDTNCATVDNTALVSDFDAPPCSGTSHSSLRKESAPAAIQPQCHSPTPPQVDSDGLQIVRMSLQRQRLSEPAIDIAYIKDPRLCIVECLQEYIVRTKPLRGEETQLLISFVKPHKAVSKDTTGRWVKCVLTNAGIDTNQFDAHSTRSASTSAAKRSGLDMTTIMKAAGWSNASTFALFYDKPIEQSPDANFGQAVLSHV